MFNVSNRNTRTRGKICSKLTIKTPDGRHWRRSGVFVNFEHISHFVLLFLLLTLSRQMSTGFVALKITETVHSLNYFRSYCIHRGGSRTAATSKMELFVIIANGFQSLTIITKCSILDVAVVLDPTLIHKVTQRSFCSSSTLKIFLSLVTISMQKI